MLSFLLLYFFPDFTSLAELKAKVDEIESKHGNTIRSIATWVSAVSSLADLRAKVDEIEIKHGKTIRPLEYEFLLFQVLVALELRPTRSKASVGNP